MKGFGAKLDEAGKSWRNFVKWREKRLDVGGWRFDVGSFLNQIVNYRKVDEQNQLLECWIVGMFPKTEALNDSVDRKKRECPD